MNMIKKGYFVRLANKLFTGKLRQKIFFMHIPKCGGTSISSAIRYSYGFSKAKESDYSFQLNAAASLKAAQILNTKELEFIENLLIYCMSINTLKYIDGHFFYSQKAFEEYGNEWTFITLLRNPVSKWFSKYFYNRFKDTQHYKLDCDLETYIESETGISEGSDYVRCLTGINKFHDSSSQYAVDQAIANLNNFELVGTLEKLSLFEKKFKRKFGTKLFIEQLRKNPLPKSEQNRQVDDRLKNKVEEICQPDIKVYNAALARIEK